MMRSFFALAGILLGTSLGAQTISLQSPLKGCGVGRQISQRDPRSRTDLERGTVVADDSLRPSGASKHDNPRLRGALFGIADGISLASQTDTYSFSGSRKKAWIGRSIIVDDQASAPASGPATASYGLSIYMQRPEWNTSAITGEVDPISLVVRQANGDAAGILSNILTRNGFGAAMESYTGTANIKGAPIKAVNTQLGVSNSRDGTNYGLVVQSVLGSNLNAGIRIASNPGTNWANYIEIVSASGEPVAYIRGTDGTFVGRSIAPATTLTASIGTPTNVYASTFTRNLVVDMQSFSTLPICNAAANGTIAYIGDARTPITAWQQIVTAGGGRNRAYISCNGSNWRAFSS